MALQVLKGDDAPASVLFTALVSRAISGSAVSESAPSEGEGEGESTNLHPIKHLLPDCAPVQFSIVIHAKENI